MKTLKSTQGTTMVEVIVAFTVLVLIIGIFSQALTMAGTMFGRANKMMTENHQLAGKYYLDEIEPATEPNQELTFRSSNGQSISIDAVVRKYSEGSGLIVDVIPETTAEQTEP